LAKRTRYREEIFDLAFRVLVEPEIGWLEPVAGHEIIKDASYSEDWGHATGETVETGDFGL
jgi:hypothetical protein